MSVFHENMLIGASGQVAAGGISRSLRFNSSDSAFLSRAVSSAGNRKTFTFSCWLKRGALSSTTTYQQLFSAGTSLSSRDGFFIDADTDDTLAFYSAGGLVGTALMFRTNAVFRDTSAWYHILLSIDTTQATSTNRVKLYVNSVEQTFATITYPSQNADSLINSAITHNIAAHLSSGEYLSGYLADIHFIDGQALTPSSFTEVSATTGQLIPKAYTGTFTGNSFWLKFADNSAATATTLGKDSSGLGNNWTPNNLSVTAGAGNDSLVDTPVSSGTDDGLGGSVQGNYCTLNPLNTSSIFTLSNGNLNYLTATAANMGSSIGTIGVSSGKWYWEGTLVSARGSFGVARQGAGITVDPGTTSLIYYYRFDGNKYNNGGSTYGATYAANDVIGVALDLDAGTLTFYKNGVSQGTAFSSLPSDTYFPQAGDDMTSFTTEGILNFGQRPFAYTAPSGFKALCDTNLPAPAVAKPNTVMDVATWSGDSAASRSITFSQSISPDLVWVKCRSNSAYHGIYDSVRGVNRVIFPNDTLAEINTPGNGYVSAFNSNGFTLTAGSLSSDDTNQSGRTYVGWAWDAGSSTVTNTQGSITSSVRANASAGFSIVTWVNGNNTSPTANTLGHGLGVIPHLVIVKSRTSGTADWAVKSEVFSNPVRDELYLNSTAAKATAGVDLYYRTNTVLGFRETSIGGNGDNMVAYCFAPVAGYSAMGSYSAGSEPFIYLGFKPAFLMVKCSTSADNWNIFDNRRSASGSNVIGYSLQPNLSNAEYQSEPGIDFLSNGFKLKGSVNTAGQTYIYFAVAESPFQYARAR